MSLLRAKNQVAVVVSLVNVLIPDIKDRHTKSTEYEKRLGLVNCLRRRCVCACACVRVYVCVCVWKHPYCSTLPVYAKYALLKLICRKFDWWNRQIHKKIDRNCTNHIFLSLQKLGEVVDDVIVFNSLVHALLQNLHTVSDLDLCHTQNGLRSRLNIMQVAI